MSGIDSLNSIINVYLEKNPSYRLVSKDKLVEQMVADGVITREQANQILNSLSIFGVGFNNILMDSLNNFGFYKNNTSKNKYHFENEFVRLDNNGKFDSDFYTLDNLKQLVSEKGINYKVNYVKNENSENIGFIICKNDVQMLFIDISDSENILFNFMKDDKFEEQIIIKNGELFAKKRFENNELKEEKLYSNGVPYSYFSSEKGLSFYLVNDLIDDINAKNSLGLPTTRKSIKNNILKRINENNVFNTLVTYKQLTGNDLIYDIENEWGLDDDLKNKLISHIKLMTQKSNELQSSTYIAQSIADEIYGLSNSNLETYINMINENNVQNVLVAYREASLNKSYERYQSISDFINISMIGSVLNNYFQIPDFVVNQLPQDFIDNYLVPTEMLLESINEEISIPKEKRDKMIAHIMEYLMKSINEHKYSDDILSDIEQNSDDVKKLGIDITRLSNRGNLLPKEEIIFEKPNGKLDVPTRQGNVGDCWMIAPILSALPNDTARTYLENYCLEFNEETGDVTVNMRGVGVSYIIFAKDIENSNHLAQGDGDIRAIEIAVDRFIKEQAYCNNKFNIDIDGNFMDFFYKLFFGNAEVIEWNDCPEKDFNDKNKLFTINYDDDKYFSLSSSSEELEQMTELFFSNHAYVIVSSDDEYIYLVNPHGKFNEDEENPQFIAEDFNNFKPFPVKKSLLKELNPDICETKILK